MPHLSVSNGKNVSRPQEKLEQLALLNFLAMIILLCTIQGHAFSGLIITIMTEITWTPMALLVPTNRKVNR